MITRYTLRAGRFVEDRSGFWVVYDDHKHEVQRSIAASEDRNKRFAAQIESLEDELRRARM